MKIGYQGEEGSNAEAAAKQFAKDNSLEIKDEELIPLTDSKTVISALKEKKVDFAVVATRNSLAGTVKETFDAIKNEELQYVATVVLPIHHFLYIKPGVKKEEIDTIASHIQALNQTTDFREREFPFAQEKEMRDTAMAARLLKEESLPETCAVICRKEAGEKYGLQLLHSNIENDSKNKTEFRVFKLPEIRSS